MKTRQKQHYVPQFLLRNWMGPDNKIGVFRKDIPGMPYRRCSPRSTGFERGVYSLEGIRDADMNIVEEKVLGPIDSSGARVVNKILQSGLSEISRQNVDCLLIFAASLELRHPDQIENVKDIAYSVMNEDIEDGSEVAKRALDYIEQHPEIVNNLPKKNLGPHIWSRARISRKELKSFALLDFTGQRDHLLLSDFPLIHTSGLNDPNAVVVLPISPRKVVLGFKTPMARHDLLSTHPLRTLLFAINRDSLHQTTRRVYALDDTPRRFLEVSLEAERQG